MELISLFTRMSEQAATSLFKLARAENESKSFQMMKCHLGLGGENDLCNLCKDHQSNVKHGLTLVCRGRKLAKGRFLQSELFGILPKPPSRPGKWLSLWNPFRDWEFLSGFQNTIPGGEYSQPGWRGSESRRKSGCISSPRSPRSRHRCTGGDQDTCNLCTINILMKKTWRSHLVVGEEGIVVLIDAKVDDVSPVKIYLRIILNEEPDMEAETLPPLLANIPAGLATSVLNIKLVSPFEPKLWNHLNNTNHPDDHLAKLFQILVVTLIQETELRCFRALRANASEIFIFQQFKEVF